LKKEVLFSYDLNVDDKIYNCSTSKVIDLNTTYKLYFQISNSYSYSTDCYTGYCNSLSSYNIYVNDTLFQNFSLPEKYTGFDALWLTPSKDTNGSCDEVKVYYNTGNYSKIVPCGTTTAITYEEETINVTFTYSPSSNLTPCNQTTCPGDSLSDYYVGTIEFSTSS
jgi:hypothetical protein